MREWELTAGGVLTKMAPAWRIGAVLALALLANLAALMPLGLWPRAVALWIVLIALPGLLAAAVLLAWPTTWMQRWHFGLFGVGLGYVLLIVGMWGLSLLPGGVAGWQVLVVYNALCAGLALIVAMARRIRSVPQPLTYVDGDEDGDEDDETPRHRPWQIAAFVSVLLVAALLRLPELGYSDFHGDEARAMLRASEVIQGYESALLIHKKGPAEILLPTAFYAVLGTMTEGVARLPFALANLTAILAALLLGWRMAGPIAGWVAAMLLAVDGYLIGFARFVQYQSVVLLMIVLVVLALYTQMRRGRATRADLWLAALCFAGGLLAHYEMLWAALPGLYLLITLLRRGETMRRLLRLLVWPVLAAAALLALFYIPFVLDPRFARTADDIFGNRIGSDFPYNNLWDVMQRSTIYSASYYVFTLGIGTLAALAMILRRHLPLWATWTATGLAAAGVLVSLLRPEWLVIGTMDLTWLFYAAVAAPAILLPRVTVEERAVWLWLGVAWVLTIFFVSKPNTHTYTSLVPWALAVAFAAGAGWRRLAARAGQQTARWIALPLAGALLLVFANYAYWYFVYTDVEILRTWAANHIPGYWVPYELPNRGALFGFPYRPGWKVVGALYADGTLDAPFDSNETSFVTDWYSRGLYFCPPDREYYLLDTSVQPDRQPEYENLLFELDQNGFVEFGRVEVAGDPRLRIFTTHALTGPMRVFDEADYAPIFDARLAGARFLKNGPLPDGVALTEFDRQAAPVDFRVGERFRLVGYRLSATQLAPGDKLRLRLYWQMIKRDVDQDYKMSVQVIDLKTLHKAAQRDSEPGCRQYATDEWRVGDINLDPYTLTIAPDTPPGVYTLLVGVYVADQEPLPVADAQGANLGNSILLPPVEVVAP